MTPRLRRAALALLTVVAACGGDDDSAGSPPEGAVARRISDAADLIGGPLAGGRIGDYLLANERIRVIIKQPGRDFSFLLTYGGNIVDADIARPRGTAGRDNFGAMTPLINVSSTVNVEEIEILNDGSDGEPAVLRTFGRDDLLDAIDPNNAISSISGGLVGLPPNAVDNDIPVRVETVYTLAAGDDAVRIETIVLNEGDEALAIYVGDFVNASGEVDTFVPSFGFGEIIYRPTIPYLAFPGVGEATGVTYGLIPIPFAEAPLTASGFGQAGFFAYLIGQNILDVLLTGAPGVLTIPAGETRSFTRYFVITEGDIGAIAGEQQRLVGSLTGEIAGRVTTAGEAASGALVSVVQSPGDLGAPYNVVGAFRSDEDGVFGGTLPPGDYQVMAKLPGHPYDSGTEQPDAHPVTIVAGARSDVTIDLPATGFLRVAIADERGDPLPAKVSLVGFDRAPDPGNHTTVAIVEIDGFVFAADTKQRGAELFGLAGVFFAGADGEVGPIEVPPGDYEVYVSRGPEYSLYRERIHVDQGATTSVDAALLRVLDTGGFVSADHHVHLLNSLDSHVTRAERLLTMAAEGVEYFVATDHDFLTDLNDDLSRLDLEGFLATDVGAEVTTFNFGHFNAWPLQRQPDQVAGGPIDWGRAGVPPGMDYPSLGSYDLSPAELFSALRERLRFGSEVGVVQINHFNDTILGQFHVMGIDTALDPPHSSIDGSLIRQDPGIANYYDDNYSALEVWIEANRTQTALLRESNLGDWFNLLNQGRIKTGTADSDTHQTAIIQAGGPRNYVASSTDLPEEIAADELAVSVAEGRVIGTNGPFVRVTLSGDDGTVAGLAADQPRLVSATSGTGTLRIEVQSALWAPFDQIEVYANTVPVPVPEEGPNGIMVPRYAVAPSFVLNAGEDFALREVDFELRGIRSGRWEADVELPLAAENDTWVMVLVRGTDGVSPPLWPMNPQDLDQESNTTLDDLTDGNLGEGGNPALAFTNPLFLDVDGNGHFDPSHERP